MMVFLIQKHIWNNHLRCIAISAHFYKHIFVSESLRMCSYRIYPKSKLDYIGSSRTGTLIIALSHFLTKKSSPGLKIVRITMIFINVFKNQSLSMRVEDSSNFRSAYFLNIFLYDCFQLTRQDHWEQAPAWMEKAKILLAKIPTEGPYLSMLCYNIACEAMQKHKCEIAVSWLR